MAKTNDSDLPFKALTRSHKRALWKCTTRRLGHWFQRVKQPSVQTENVGCVSDADQHEASEFGDNAVLYGMFGNRAGSVEIRRTGHCSVDYEQVLLGLVVDGDLNIGNRQHPGPLRGSVLASNGLPARAVAGLGKRPVVTNPQPHHSTNRAG